MTAKRQIDNLINLIRQSEYMRSSRFRRMMAMLLALCLVLSAAAVAGTASAAQQYVMQNLVAEVFTDSTYSQRIGSDPVQITVAGELPPGTTVKAYPAEINGANVCDAYDITLFDTEADELEPQSAVQVTISSDRIREAIRDNKALAVHHIDEQRGTEDIDIVSQDEDSVVFRAERFSVYYVVVDHEGDDEILEPRVEFHFLDQNIGGIPRTIAGNAVYDINPFSFYNKGKSPDNTQTTQILKDGEEMELIANPPNVQNSYFYGWYLVDSYSISEMTDSFGIQRNDDGEVQRLYYTWPVEPDELPFEQNISIDAPNKSPGAMLSWSIGDVGGTAKMDELGVAHVFVAPVYEDYHFVNFMQHARDEMISGAQNVMTRKLFVFGSAPSVSVKISDVRSPSTDAVRLVFNGWEYSTDNGATYNMIQTVDYTGAELTGENSDDIFLDVFNDVDLYPVFVEARWVDFNRGKTGNGATYVKSRYMKAWKDSISMAEVEEENILTKLDVPELTGYNFDGWVLDPTGFDDNGIPLGGVRITDGSGNVLLNSELASVNGSAYSGGYTVNIDGKKAYTVIDGKLKFWDGLDKRLTLYAKWSPKATADYTVLVWKQKASDGVGLADSEKSYDYEESTVILNKATGRNVDAVKTDSELYTYLHKSYTGFKTNPRVEMSTETLEGDGSTIVNIYYDRETYHLYFRKKNSNQIDTSKTITALYGHDIVNNWPVNDNDSKVWQEATDKYRAILFQMPNEDWTYTYYNDSGSYIYDVNYKMENINDDEYTSSYSDYEKYHGDKNAFNYQIKKSANQYNAAEISGFSLIRAEGLSSKTQITKPNYQWVLNDIYKNPDISTTVYGTEALAPYYTGSAHYQWDFYYKRNVRNIDFYANYPTGNNLTWENIGGELNKSPAITTVNNIKYGRSLSSFEPGMTDEYMPQIPDHYRFTGWYEDATCKVKFNFATATMPDTNMKLYAGWEPVRYRVEVDPNGAEIDHINHNTTNNGYAGFDIDTFRGSANGSYVTSMATYFNAEYGEAIGEYKLKREYIPMTQKEVSEGTIDKYWYVNTQYQSDHGRGIATDARNALFVKDDELSTYYNFYRQIKNANVTYIPTWTEDVSNFETWKARYVSGPYRKCNPGETYTFLGWYQVFDDGTLAYSPYNFNDPVTGNMKLRAIWRLEGGIYIQYHTVYSYMDDGSLVQVSGRIEQWTDPEYINNQLYSDQAPTNIIQQPTDITIKRNGVQDDSVNYIFRGWRVVKPGDPIYTSDGPVKTWEPMEDPVVYYDPGQAFTIDTKFVSTEDEINNGMVIHVQAYYQVVDKSDRRPYVTNLTLDANTDYHGKIDTNKTDSDLPALYGGGSERIEGSSILLGDIQSNIPVRLYQYSTVMTEDDAGNTLSPPGKQFFVNSDEYLLIGFDENKDPNALSTGYPFIPKAAADSVISISRDSRETLYAVWEPMLYATFINTTDCDIELDLQDSTYGVMQVQNLVTGTYGREKHTNDEKIIVPAKTSKGNGKIKIVFPMAKADVDRVVAKGINKHSGYLLSAVSSPGTGSNTEFADKKYNESFTIADTLFSSSTGVEITFTEEQSPNVYFDLNGGAWAATPDGYTNEGSSLYSVPSDSGNIPPPNDPTLSGKVFSGWTTEKDDYSTLFDFSSTPVTPGMMFYAFYWTPTSTTVPVRYLMQNSDGTYFEITNNNTYLNQTGGRKAKKTLDNVGATKYSLPYYLKYNSNNPSYYLTNYYRSYYTDVSYAIGDNDVAVSGTAASGVPSETFGITDIMYYSGTANTSPYIRNSAGGIQWSSDSNGTNWSTYGNDAAVYVIYSRYEMSHVTVKTVIQGDAADPTKPFSFTGTVTGLNATTDRFSETNGDTHVINLAYSNYTTSQLTLSPSDSSQYEGYSVEMYVNGEEQEGTLTYSAEAYGLGDVVVTYVFTKNPPPITGQNTHNRAIVPIIIILLLIPPVWLGVRRVRRRYFRI